MTQFVVPIVIERYKDGYYAECPAFKACFTRGDTYEEALASIREAVTWHLRDRLDRDDEFEIPELVSVTTLAVSACS